MKFQLQIVCLFLFSIFSVVFTLTDAEEKKIADTCQKETGASNDDMKVLDDINAMPKSKKQICLVACVYKATGYMDANNKLVYEKAVKELEPLKKDNKEVYDKLDKIIKECAASISPDKDQCDSLKKYLDCVTQKAKDGGIDV